MQMSNQKSSIMLLKIKWVPLTTMFTRSEIRDSTESDTYLNTLILIAPIKYSGRS